MVCCNPQLYIDEYQDWFFEVTGKDCSTRLIGKYMLRMGFTHQTLSIAAYEQNERIRNEHRAFVYQFPPEMFVFVDESSADSRTSQRRKGHLPKGSKNVRQKGVFVKKNRHSVMAALDYYGILGSLVVEGSYTGELFTIAFMKEVLPYLGRFMYGEDRSIVVLDNCRVHNAKLVQMIRDKGAIVHFLPPYSPDLMPIEFAFHFLKCWLRRNRGYAAQYPKISIYRAFEDITENMAQNYIHACGY